MTSGSKQPDPRRWVSLFVMALVAALATALLETTASAFAGVGAQNRVGAISLSVAVPVELPLAESPGQRLGEAAPRVVTVVATGVAANTTVTMGRAMEGRVIPYAMKHGYGYYKGTPKVIPRSLEKIAPNTLRKVDLWFNKRWVNGQMRRGNKIVDIGEPPGMPPSQFYDMERRLTNGYWNYVQDIQP